MDDKQVKQIGDNIGIDWDDIDFDEFEKALDVEMEHGTVNPETNITNDDPEMTAKIGVAHLNEIPDYYTRLNKMEQEGKEDLDMAKDIKMKFTPNKNGGEVSTEEMSNDVGFGQLPKIGGGGLMAILGKLVSELGKTKQLNNPFEVLEDLDLKDGDDVNKIFKDKLGGCNGVCAIVQKQDPDEMEHFADVLGMMENVRFANRTSLLRETFGFVRSAMNGNKTAVAQVKAAKNISNLLSDCIDPKEYKYLVAAKEGIISGDYAKIDASSWRIKEVFSSYVPAPNIRVAYTTLNTQDNEPYLMCPKARYQTGVTLPMEIGKCRSNCIDSRTTTDGKVVCAYAEWIKLADSQNEVNDRFEVHRNPDNKENLLTLNKNERSKKPKDFEKNWEQRLEEEKYPEIPELSLEARLDKASNVELGHHGEPKEEALSDVMGVEPGKDGKQTTAAKKNLKIDPDKDETLGEQVEQANTDEDCDETIEEMLADEHVGLTDDELDMLLDEWISEKRDKK